MKISGSIALIAIGAILSFAIQDIIAGVDLTLIGYILMGAGALALILSILLSRPKPINRVSETRAVNDPGTGETVRRTEVSEN